MIRALLKNKIAEDEKKEIIKYIQQFQSPKDGFFYDKAILNDLFYNSDWWGARHLVCHVLPVLNILQSEPNYPFAVTKQYDSPAKISKWLAQLSHLGTSSDFDNQIMNIATLLQYARDHFNDSKAGNALEYLIAQICSKINSREGLWIPPKDQYTSQEISVKVQFAYHLYVILCNEGEKILYPEKLLKWVLSTQNKLGGFGISLNSSACEDIDSIYLLVKLYKMGLAEEKIYAALKRAFLWSFANWNSDGGFVFRRNEIFCYGHQNMTSIINESNLFATWFRLQSLAYLSQVLNIGDFDLSAYGKKCWLA